jgi:hypothetical protein
MNTHPETFPEMQSTGPWYTRTVRAAIGLLLIGLLLIVVPCSAADTANSSGSTFAASQTSVSATPVPSNVTTSPTDRPVTGVTTVPATLPEKGRKTKTVANVTKDLQAGQPAAGATSVPQEDSGGTQWIAWQEPVTILPALARAGYGLSMARDEKTGLLHLSYIEYSNKSESPGKLVYQNGTGTSWSRPVVIDDTIGFYHRDVPESVRHTSITLGPGGEPHILYMSWNTGYQQKYASMVRQDETSNGTTYRAGQWVVLTVASRDFNGWGSSVVVDRSGRSHFSYLHQDGIAMPLQLYYGTLFPGSVRPGKMIVAQPPGGLSFFFWKETTRAGMQTSIALDSQDRLRISYPASPYGFDPVSGTCRGDIYLNYAVASQASNNSPMLFTDSWLPVSVDTSPGPWTRVPVYPRDTADQSVMLYSSMALDAGDNAHISSYDCGHGNCSLDYYRLQKDGTVTVSETIDSSSGMAGEYSSLRLDAGGNPRIAYIDGNGGIVRFAARVNGSWRISTPPGQNQTAGQFTALALDDNGNPDIVYLDAAGGQLKYLHGKLLQ